MIQAIRGLVLLLSIFTSHRTGNWMTGYHCAYDCHNLETRWTGDIYGLRCPACHRMYVTRNGLVYESWAIHQPGWQYIPQAAPPPDPPRYGHETYADYAARIDRAVHVGTYNLSDLPLNDRRIYNKGKHGFALSIIK